MTFFCGFADRQRSSNERRNRSPIGSPSYANIPHYSTSSSHSHTSSTSTSISIASSIPSIATPAPSSSISVTIPNSVSFNSSISNSGGRPITTASIAGPTFIAATSNFHVSNATNISSSHIAATIHSSSSSSNYIPHTNNTALPTSIANTGNLYNPNLIISSTVSSNPSSNVIYNLSSGTIIPSCSTINSVVSSSINSIAHYTPPTPTSTTLVPSSILSNPTSSSTTVRATSQNSLSQGSTIASLQHQQHHHIPYIPPPATVPHGIGSLPINSIGVPSPHLNTVTTLQSVTVISTGAIVNPGVPSITGITTGKIMSPPVTNYHQRKPSTSIVFGSEFLTNIVLKFQLVYGFVFY